MKKLINLTILVLLCAALTACAWISPAKERPFETQIILHVMDVGQGDALLLVSPNNKTMLIDAGEKTASGKIASVIKSYGTDRLNAVVATHPHADHIGGLLQTLKAFNWDEVYMPNAAHTTQTYISLLEYIDSAGKGINLVRAGMRIPFDDGIDVEILAPNGDAYKELNDYSVVLRVTYGNVRFLLTGDAQGLSEDEILDAFDDIQADMLKVGHHGSDTSTTESFLTAVSPSIAVISCGKENKYGHPSEDVLARLEERGISVFRTDTDGDVIVYSDGESIVTETGK